MNERGGKSKVATCDLLCGFCKGYGGSAQRELRLSGDGYGSGGGGQCQGHRSDARAVGGGDDLASAGGAVGERTGGGGEEDLSARGSASRGAGVERDRERC